MHNNQENKLTKTAKNNKRAKRPATKKRKKIHPIRNMDSEFLQKVNNMVSRPKPSGDYHESITVTNLPFIGRIHIVNDKNGMMQLGFVLAYWVYGTCVSLFLILLPQYYDGQVSIAVVACEYIFEIIMLVFIIIPTSCHATITPNFDLV